MLRKDKFKGSLKSSFAYVDEHNFSDDKFIQSVPVFLDDAAIERLLHSEKYPIIGMEIKKPKLPSTNFGDLAPSAPLTITYDYCQSGLKFMVTKNYDQNGKLKLDLLATYTLKTAKGMSIGLYYLPNGNLKNVCFLARVCHHKGTNSHINTDGTVIDKNSLHIHKISEKYIKECLKKYKDNPALMVSKLQSADATVVPGYENCSIKQMVDILKEQFNISDIVIAVDEKQIRTLFPQMVNAISEIEKFKKESEDGIFEQV